MRTRRYLPVATAGAVLCTVAALAIPAAPAGAASRAAGPAHTYLVDVKSPTRLISTSAQREAVVRSQRDVRNLLASMHVRVESRMLAPDALTVRLNAAEVRRLRGLPNVLGILASASVPLPTSSSTTVHATSAHAIAGHGHAVHGDASTLCGTASHPQLNPEALLNIDAEPAILSGADGAGVNVAYIADGVDTTNPDFQRNAAFASPGSPAGSPVISDVDLSGDGSAAPTGGDEAFIDSSSIVAQGNTVYDISNNVNASHPLPTGCDITVQGDAPGATVTGIEAFGGASASNVVLAEAVNYAVTHGVKVLNESFGGNPFPDDAADTVKLANDAATAAGVTVVVSSGDSGISSTIGNPSDDPNVISVGASTTFRQYLQSAFGGINAPGLGSGKYIDNNISSLSSGGIAQNGQTVDLVAPGDLNWALCSTNPNFSECGGSDLEQAGGTSESAPLTAGAAADVIQAYAQTHGGADPSPALVKHILTSSADDVAAPGDQQGAGLLDIGAAVNLARSIAGTSQRFTTGGLLANTSQLNLSGLPHGTARGTVALTNTSSFPQVVAPYARQLLQRGQVAGSVTMDPSVGTTQPYFPIWSGVDEIYQEATFNVPGGTDRLKFDASYQDTDQGSLLHFALFSPSGAYAGYSLPQGLGDHGDVEVANPQPGKWTAFFFTEWDGYAAGAAGTSGPVPWDASFWDYAPAGNVSPGLTVIPSGATRNVSVSLPTGSNPGDTAYSLVLGGGMTIPVTLRTQIDVNAHSGGTFAGVLTGGNGRSGEPAQTNTWSFTVPKGKADLDASIAMASNPGGGLLPGDQFAGLLVDPNGQIAAYDSNYTQDSSGFDVTPYLSLYAAAPVAGQWELVIDWVQPTMGVANQVPFTGAVRFNQVSAASALPDAASAGISATTGATYGITVNNTGVAPLLLSTDARLPTSATYPIGDLFGTPATQPIYAGSNPSNSYYIPTETSSVTVSQTSTVPASFDFSTYSGDPDVSPINGNEPGVTATQTSSSASIVYTPATGVGPGLWFNGDIELGPFGTGPEPSGSETTSVTATTAAFDPAVTSSSGDVVQAYTTGGGGALNPVEVDPGTSTTIQVTINPTASVGSVVSGTLYVNGLAAPGVLVPSLGPAQFFTNTIAAFPYAYTVTP